MLGSKGDSFGTGQQELPAPSPRDEYRDDEDRIEASVVGEDEIQEGHSGEDPVEKGDVGEDGHVQKESTDPFDLPE